MARILVVDDEPAIRDVLRSLLKDAGYGVSTAADGLAALALIENDPPDLLITDIRMPRLDGWHLLEHVRTQDPDLPVILLTATNRRTPGYAAVFIPKPFNSDHLLTIIARLLVA